MSSEISISGEHISEAAAPIAAEQGSLSSAGQQEQYVPLTALQQERANRQRIEEELQVIKNHVSLLHANQNRPQEKPRDEFDGLSDSDVMTVGEFKKFANQYSQRVQTTVEELRLAQQNPDYHEVISHHLPEILNKNPDLAASIKEIFESNPIQAQKMAYALAKNSDSYRSKNHTVQRNADAERIVKNAQQSGSLSAIGSTSPMSQARRYKDMSEADFRKEVQKNMGHF